MQKVFIGSAKTPESEGGSYTTAHVVMGTIVNERRDDFAFRIGDFALIFTRDDNDNIFAEVRPIRKEDQKDGKNVEE